ncbi:hypothetical protein C8J57DRAFT_1716832 [Mycena rebaudengoi]|nr:hypothetical protein C8J57DRAFT_1716832 [Mycena rebaudengoi]
MLPSRIRRNTVPPGSLNPGRFNMNTPAGKRNVYAAGAAVTIAAAVYYMMYVSPVNSPKENPMSAWKERVSREVCGHGD